MFGFFRKRQESPLGEIQRRILASRSRNVRVALEKDGRRCELVLAPSSFFATDGESIDIYAAPAACRERYRFLFGTDRFSPEDIARVDFL